MSRVFLVLFFSFFFFFFFFFFFLSMEVLAMKEREEQEKGRKWKQPKRHLVKAMEEGDVEDKEAQVWR